MTPPRPTTVDGDIRIARFEAVVSQYMINADHPSDAIIIERERGQDRIRWVVRMRGYCLTKQGEWEIEPPLSSRDTEFYRTCRWLNPEEALEAAAHACDEMNGG